MLPLSNWLNPELVVATRTVPALRLMVLYPVSGAERRVPEVTLNKLLRVRAVLVLYQGVGQVLQEEFSGHHLVLLKR